MSWVDPYPSSVRVRGVDYVWKGEVPRELRDGSQPTSRVDDTRITTLLTLNRRRSYHMALALPLPLPPGETICVAVFPVSYLNNTGSQDSTFLSVSRNFDPFSRLRTRRQFRNEGCFSSPVRPVDIPPSPGPTPFSWEDPRRRSAAKRPRRSAGVSPPRCFPAPDASGVRVERPRLGGPSAVASDVVGAHRPHGSEGRASSAPRPSYGVDVRLAVSGRARGSGGVGDTPRRAR